MLGVPVWKGLDVRGVRLRPLHPRGETEMKPQKFPPGWDEKRVKEVIAHFGNQTEDEEHAEIEAALKAENVTLMDIPTDLVPKVRALLARKRSA